MAEFNFIPPLNEADARKVSAGDCVYLDGVLFGVRDANLIRVFDQGVKPPVDWRGAALLHTAPNVKKIGPGKYEAICVARPPACGWTGSPKDCCAITAFGRSWAKGGCPNAQRS